MKRRGSGVLLHITSLPSAYGIGDLGPGAYSFVDFLSKSKQSFWQILPLTPTQPGLGNSPYSSSSAFAGNPLLLSPEFLVQDGWLTRDEGKPWLDVPGHVVDFGLVSARKAELGSRAYDRFKSDSRRHGYEFEEFCSDNDYWLKDYAVFAALKGESGGLIWSDWPAEIRYRRPAELSRLEEHLRDSIEREKFLQFVFARQWRKLKAHCDRQGIQIIGDAPFYVSYDSADIWSNPELFKLDDGGRPIVVAGVPPDYFSQTGQRWGNPIYRWEALEKTGFSWWVQRVRHNLKMFDIVRIDHFRGFAASYEIPHDEETAINGQWVDVPGEAVLRELLRHIPTLPLLAEDLGLITPDVRELMRQFELPGMRVLLFAFGEDLGPHPFVPHNYVKNCVAYTGTHDNNTVRGWFDCEASDQEKVNLSRYLGREVAGDEIHWEMIRLAMMSVAKAVIIPLQDILGLGQDSRMNRPATAHGNWSWRYLNDQLTSEVVARLRDLTETYGRS